LIDYQAKFSLLNRRATVIGGAGLLGGEITAALAGAGAETLLLDVEGSRGRTLAEDLSNRGLRVEFVPFDVTDLEMVERTMRELWEEHGKIHALVNASYPRTEDWGARVDDIPLESWRRNVDMQLTASFLVSRATAEMMRQHDVAGSIVALGSIYGVVGNDFTVYEKTAMNPPAAYAAIKGGMTNLTRYLASYYGRYNIRVNTLCPGGIFDNQDPVFVAQYSQKVPLRRMGNPEDVAAAALFLTCEASSYITGTAFMVDGGWTAI
jgi:NAD(P)-dependent dehydrogenase (short-subunit alcohol dehydrogenase family)